MTAAAAASAVPRPLLREILARQRRRAVVVALCWSSHQICEAMVPVAFGLVIDRAIRTGNGAAMAGSVVAIFALFIVLTMSWRTGNWVLTRAVQEESHTLRLETVATVLGAERTGERQRGEQLSIVTSDALRAAEVVEVVAWLTAASVGLLSAAFWLLRIDWLLGAGILVAVPLTMVAVNALAPLLERRTSAQQETVGLAAALAADLLRGLRPLRGFGGVPEATRRYRQVSRTSLSASVRAAGARGALEGVTVLSAGLLLAAVAAVAAWLAVQGRLSVGELITVVGLAAFVSDPIHTLSRVVRSVAEARASAARVEQLRQRPREAPAVASAHAVGPLVFDQVTAPGLTRASFTVRPGEMVGVVPDTPTIGASVAQLISAARPSAGAVRLAGVPVTEIDPATLRHLVLVEPHTVDLFGTSVREALDTGEPRDDAQRWAALDAAAVEGFAEPDELLDHALLDRGSNLSGGQRQRVALARALLAGRPVTVFCDPTTAVDAVTENRIADGLRRIRVTDQPGQLVTVLIASNPPLLSRCDRVVYLAADGRVHEGRHGELVALPGYAEAVLR